MMNEIKIDASLKVSDTYITCTNIGRMRFFYGNILGLKEITRYKNNSTVFYDSNTNRLIEISQKKENDSFIIKRGSDHFIMIVEDIFEKKKELSNRGIRLETDPEKDNYDFLYMWIRDPEDNRIEIKQYLLNSFV